MNLQDLRRDAAHGGWTRVLVARTTTRLQNWLGVHVFRVNFRPTPKDPLEPAPPNGIRLCLLRPEELLEAAADPELDLDPDFIRAAVAQGDVTVGAFEGARLVAYSWSTFVAAPFYEGLWVRVGRPYRYIYKSLTRPSHRARRIYIAIMRLADAHFLERGCAGEIGFTNIANLASLGSQRSLGRRKVGYTGYITLFGQCFSFRTPAVKRLGVVIFRPPARVPNQARAGPGPVAVTMTTGD
jgi:hypothetical protein